MGQVFLELLPVEWTCEVGQEIPYSIYPNTFRHLHTFPSEVQILLFLKQYVFAQIMVVMEIIMRVMR